MPPDGKWGARNPDGSWNGMVNQLRIKEADVGKQAKDIMTLMKTLVFLSYCLPGCDPCKEWGCGLHSTHWPNFKAALYQESKRQLPLGRLSWTTPLSGMDRHCRVLCWNGANLVVVNQISKARSGTKGVLTKEIIPVHVECHDKERLECRTRMVWIKDCVPMVYLYLFWPIINIKSYF